MPETAMKARLFISTLGVTL